MPWWCQSPKLYGITHSSLADWVFIGKCLNALSDYLLPSMSLYAHTSSKENPFLLFVSTVFPLCKCDYPGFAAQLIRNLTLGFRSLFVIITDCLSDCRGVALNCPWRFNSLSTQRDLPTVSSTKTTGSGMNYHNATSRMANSNLFKILAP